MGKHKEGAGSAAKATRVAAFEPAEFLDNEEVITEYLIAARKDPNPDVLRRAIANVAKARAQHQNSK